MRMTDYGEGSHAEVIAWHAAPMKRWLGLLLLLSLALVGRGSDEPYAGAESGAVVVLLPQGADPVVERTAEALQQYLAKSVGVAPTTIRLPAGASEGDIVDAAKSERAGLVIVMYLTDQEAVASLPDGSYRITSDDRGSWTNRLEHGTGATFVFLSGASKLAKQYAAYELSAAWACASTIPRKSTCRASRWPRFASGHKPRR